LPGLVVILVALGLVLVVGLALWSMWRDRRVDFVHQVTVGSQTEAHAADVLDQVVPVLVRDGYRMVANAGHTVVFERRSSLVGPIVISVLLFPLGLLALLGRSRETVTFVSAGPTLELYGDCSKPVADYLVAVADDVAGRLAIR
jgi:hypothetical protein